MKVTECKLPGVRLLEPVVYEDARGFFMESYNRHRLASMGVDIEFVQHNHSFSLPVGVLRGLHYQRNPKPQTKLVRVVAGAIYDVVVDIRQGSPTFGQWQRFELTAANKRQLLVPRGFAHGFCTLEPRTEVLYQVDEQYSVEDDRGIAWNDPDLAIAWPVAVPLLSEKDARLPRLAEADMNFVFER